MPNVYKPGLLQIKPQYDENIDSGDHPENVLWYLSSSLTTPTVGDLAAISAPFDLYFGNLWAAVGASTLHYTGSIITDWSSNTGAQYDSVGIWTPTPGEHTAQVCPPQCAVLLSYRTTERFRGGHFRTYFPYVATNILTGTAGDKITSGVISTLGSRYATLETGMEGSGVLGGQHQVLYRNRNSTVDARLYPVSAYGFQTVLATQRRRIRKVPHH